MKRAILFLLAGVTFAVYGCRRSEPVESLLVAGSSTFLPQVQKLAEGFMKKYPRVLVISEGGGSYAGLIAVRRGAINVAIMSRDIPDEMDDDVIESYLVARDGIGIIVNPSNPVSDLNVDQIRSILSGEIRDWGQVGGQKGAITVVIREQGSTTREGVENIIMHGIEVRRDAVQFSSGSEVSKLVAGNPRAIGYISTHYDMLPGIKLLGVEGVSMSKASILSGRYPLSRSFYLVAAHNDMGDEGDAAGHRRRERWTKRFIDFARSREGQDILEREGLYPVD